jgi:hypothetical protein
MLTAYRRPPGSILVSLCIVTELVDVAALSLFSYWTGLDQVLAWFIRISDSSSYGVLESSTTPHSGFDRRRVLGTRVVRSWGPVVVFFTPHFS